MPTEHWLELDVGAGCGHPILVIRFYCPQGLQMLDAGTTIASLRLRPAHSVCPTTTQPIDASPGIVLQSLRGFLVELVFADLHPSPSAWPKTSSQLSPPPSIDDSSYSDSIHDCDRASNRSSLPTLWPALTSHDSFLSVLEHQGILSTQWRRPTWESRFRRCQSRLLRFHL